MEVRMVPLDVLVGGSSRISSEFTVEESVVLIRRILFRRDARGLRNGSDLVETSERLLRKRGNDMEGFAVGACSTDGSTSVVGFIRIVIALHS